MAIKSNRASSEHVETVMVMVIGSGSGMERESCHANDLNAEREQAMEIRNTSLNMTNSPTQKTISLFPCLRAPIGSLPFEKQGSPIRELAISSQSLSFIPLLRRHEMTVSLPQVDQPSSMT